ncbi:MAG: sugar transferase [Desulfobacteraceae bacterium]|nr:MAG: sugar transferase [Desulfobacteraceae bacterium]
MNEPLINDADKLISNDSKSSGGLPNRQSKEIEEPFVEKNHIFCTVPIFHHMLRIERKRTERSRTPFLLLLIDISKLQSEKRNSQFLDKMKGVLIYCSRETDISGWYEENNVMGSILTEMASVNEGSIESILGNLQNRISNALDAELVKKIKVSFHVFPEQNGNAGTKNGLFNETLYPDLSNPGASRQAISPTKKLMDILGSLFALVCLSPILLIIAAAIKYTSDGPVFFRQERMGLNGETFTFLKFRSMYTDCDSDRHREYIKKYIGEGKDDKDAPGVYKISNDPRVTPLGRFLRKTSLDELPQFINVLKGDMSLVGPRPPIPYEIELYDIWHRRRLLSVKPGITGLWQVTGRSSTTFDEMVRLDLRYINEWSLLLDIKLLLKTPRVILTGKGGY